MIRIKSTGNFDKSEKFLKNALDVRYRAILERYAREGVSILSLATPKDSGLTSESWNYEIVKTPRGWAIYWTNDNVVDGVPIVILLQYGHGTRSGTFVQGEDFINPAIRPTFEKISENLWKEVNSV